MKQQEKATEHKENNDASVHKNDASKVKNKKCKTHLKEYGGRKDGLDPTRYGDWEKNGRCIDF